MLAGKLRFRVWLQKGADVVSGGGSTSVAYTNWIQVWAAIEPMTPREYLAAQAVQSDISVKIRIRYRPGLTAKLRVVHQHGPGSPEIIDTYDVEGPPVEVMSNRTEVWLMCKRRDTAGFRTGDG